jgi:predicted MFS family arabinose efflux permease
VVLVGLVVDRNPWLTMTAAVALQAVALSTQYVLGTTAGAAVVAVAAAGFGLAALSAVLGARVLVVAPGSTDMAAAGTSTAFNVGITAGALIGGVLLPAAGVRSTALAGAVLTLAALATVLAEPAIAARSRRRRAHTVARRRAHTVATSASGPGR